MSSTTDTRDRLIDTAMHLFVRQGYTSTGVAQILKESRSRSGSLYHFFPTKEDLLLAVLEKYKTLLWPLVIQPVFDRVSDPIERVFGILDGYRKMLALTGCTRGCPIGNLAIELSDHSPGARKLIAENFTGWRGAVLQCIEGARGRLPPDTDTKRLASFVLTVMEGGVMQARAYGGLEPFDEAVTSLRDYFDRLIAAGTGWRKPRRARATARKVKSSKPRREKRK